VCGRRIGSNAIRLAGGAVRGEEGGRKHALWEHAVPSLPFSWKIFWGKG